jgi:RND superfamily putative drug exporter
MRLTGRFTWWAPPALRRFHDRFGISEGGGGAAPDGAGVPHTEERRDPEPATSN